MRKYVRTADGSKIELRTIHAEFTEGAFEMRKQGTRAAIDRVDGELRILKSAEIPDDASTEQQLAIHEFNMHVYAERDRLKEMRKQLKADELLMNEV